MAENQKPKAKILIVDDVDTNRFVLRDIVTEMGYQPLLAENGVQALRVVEHIFPQLIISDIAMPQMDGLELCEHLKRDPRTRDIPIIFISAYDDANDVVKGFSIGGEDYITKPFLPEIVKARVGLHLKLYETKKELSETNRLLQTSIQEQLKQLELEKKNVLYALTRVARENAAYDAEHMERLCYNCRLVAEAMQLTKEFGPMISDLFVDTIELAAPLCDLGNVAIPSHILQKRNRLTPEEHLVMEQHVEIGSRILRDIQKTGEYNEFLQMSYEITSYHHEYYDGTGYPHGKKGEEIPLSALIVCAVSAYCALTERRPYREAYTREEAIEMMKQYSGVRYHPQICQIMGMIVRQLH